MKYRQDKMWEGKENISLFALISIVHETNTGAYQPTTGGEEYYEARKLIRHALKHWEPTDRLYDALVAQLIVVTLAEATPPWFSASIECSS